jgi:uncharacterized protein (DUF2236 family)
VASLSIASRVNAERVLLLAWARAILLQLAHPLVAAGVDDHSTFREGRLTAVSRLHHTVRAMLSLTYGSAAERDATLATINGIHRRVNGTLRGPVGPFAAGTRYSAEDPALLLWVHATLLESVPLVYNRVVRPLSDTELDEYCAEGAWVPPALGAHHGAPRSWRELQAYVAGVHASGVLVVGAQARDLGRAVLAPPLAALVWPAAYLNRLVTIGLLPPDIREQYGWTWSSGQQARMELALRMLRAARRLTPDVVALWPEARRAG